MPTCLGLASGQGDARAAGVRQGVMHVLFIVVHGLGDQAAPLVEDVLDIADETLVAAEGPVRLAALKLLGAAATAGEKASDRNGCQQECEGGGGVSQYLF